MTMNELMDLIEGKIVTCKEQGVDREILGGYVSDLLSDVMGHAKDGEVWLTIQTHPNVVAVALLLNLAAVIFPSGQIPEASTIEKAQEEGIILITTDLSTFEATGRIYAKINRGA